MNQRLNKIIFTVEPIVSFKHEIYADAFGSAVNKNIFKKAGFLLF
ncbi:MAG: hypothetical protein ACXITV_10065 [Luteibaculaceae bacterium]